MKTRIITPKMTLMKMRNIPTASASGGAFKSIPGSRRWFIPTLLLSLLLGLISEGALGAVFQFSVPLVTARGTNRAWLWIPPAAPYVRGVVCNSSTGTARKKAAPYVRGVVMAGMTLMEREFVQDPIIRKACADEQLAIIFFNCSLAAPDITKVLFDFASVSGYDELARAPLFFVGHSAGGPQAKDCAIKFANRCFGLVQYRGGVPGGSNAVPPGIPVLMMLGQFDEFGGTMRDENGRETWQSGCDALAAFRAANERNIGSVVVEPGAGHFAWSERNAAYLALFLRKTAQACLTPKGELRPVDPRTGWLSQIPGIHPGSFPPASYEGYAGPKSRASWHFDEELARATVTYHTGLTGKLDQFIRWNDPVWVDAGARFFFTKIHWVDDGRTFEVHPVYAERVPGQYDGKGPRWHDAGKPDGHSTVPILVKAVSGPVEVTDTNRLRIRFDCLAPATETPRVTFMAWSAGDRLYRYTEQVGMLPRGFSGSKSGRPQKITFEPLPDLKPDSKPIKLNATSDAGLPVEFYVAYGPAVVTNGMLRIAELPARARFPIEVKVVAWQFGRGVEPLVQTAMPVEQTIAIEKP